MVDGETELGIVVSHHVCLAYLVLLQILHQEVAIQTTDAAIPIIVFAGIDHLLAVAGGIMAIEVSIEVGQRSEGEIDHRLVAAQVDAVGTVVEVHSR